MTPETRQVPSLIGRQCSTSTLIRVLRPAVGEYPDGMDSACFQYSIPGGTSLRGRVMIHATTVSEWAQVQRELLRLEKEEEKTQVADAIAQLSAQVSTSHSTLVIHDKTVLVKHVTGDNTPTLELQLLLAILLAI